VSGRRLELGALALLVLLVVFLVGFGSAQIGDRNPSPRVPAELMTIKNANAKYRDVKQAIADGYRQTGPCVAVPDFGGMGIHYTNQRLVDDPGLDPLKPEMLLYEPTSSGGRKLMGVEYSIPVKEASKHPSMFMGHLDGPMSGHWPGQPRHYDVHLWLWKKNPRGVFDIFNPDVRC
jgi:hypothetical protein